MAGKIGFGFYPYTYARVSAMKGELIKKEDYDRLLKMEVNEITKYLGDSRYRKDIDELGVKFKGVELLERALNRNLERTFKKLKRVSDERLLVLIDAYLKRWDVHNIKTIIRGKATSTDNEEIRTLLVYLGSYDERFLSELIEKETVKDVVDSSGIDELKYLYKTTKDIGLFEIENFLDRKYYEELIELCSRLADGELFREFLENEIDMINIMNILRLKREDIEKEEIKKYLFEHGSMNKSLINKLMRTENSDKIFELLMAKRFALIKKIEYKDKDLKDIELELKKHNYDQAVLLLHQHPLSINVILGYMFTKEVEIRNLRLLIKGRQLGVDEKIIEKGIITGGKNA